MRTTISDNTAAGRYEIHVDGERAGFLSYVRDDGRIVLLHTEIDDPFRGRGLGNALIGDAIERARREGLAIEPHCSFVAAYLERERAKRPRDVSLTGVPRIGRATIIGALLGALVVGAPVAAALLAADAGLVAVIAGAHVGFFGGMGFGGMIGAVVRSDRYERTRSHSLRALHAVAGIEPRSAA